MQRLSADPEWSVSPSGLPTVVPYKLPPDVLNNIITPLPAGSDDSQTGMNLNFIGAAMFPQVQETFVPLTKTLDQVDADRFDHALDHPVIVTSHDAVENTTAQNVITIPENAGVGIYLGTTRIEASYDPVIKDYVWNNPWSFEKDNENMKTLPGLWDDGDAWPFLPKKESPAISQKFPIYYTFQAVGLGKTTLTFILNDTLHATPKTLTFQFNVVEAPATPANANEVDGSEK